LGGGQRLSGVIFERLQSLLGGKQVHLSGGNGGYLGLAAGQLDQHLAGSDLVAGAHVEALRRSHSPMPEIWTSWAEITTPER